MRSSGVRVLLRGALLLGGVAVALVTLELGLRLLDPTSRQAYVWPPFLHRTFHPDESAVPGVSGPSEFRVNSLGLRGDEWPGGDALAIVAVGGSTTECMILDQAEAWPQALQAVLEASGAIARRVWVGNAGRSGHSTRENLYQVRELLAHLPRVDLLILLEGANDLGLRLAQDDGYDPQFMERPEGEAMRRLRAFSVAPLGADPATPPLKRLELYGRARALKYRLSTWMFHEGEVQDGAGRSYVRWRENRRNATRLREEPPPLEDALDEYARNLRAIVAEASARGVPVLLMTQPSLYRADLTEAERRLLWWGGVGDFQAEGARVEFYSVAALQRAIARYNATLLSVCPAEGLRCLDLDREIEKSTRNFYDDFHFTERGSRAVAEVVAARLIDEGWLR